MSHLRLHRTLSALIVLSVVTAGSGCSYNRFTSSEEAIKAQWGQVENQMQRRSDLIPNLVATVQGFAAQERDVLQAVADARAKMAGATTPAERIAAANAESSALGRLLVVVENRLAVERMRYNERLQEYNTLRRRFPSNITAAIFGFDEYPYYDAPPEATQVPKVDFSR